MIIVFLLTPEVRGLVLPVGDPAGVLLSFLGRELHVLGQVEAPVLPKGQVRLLGPWDFLIVLQERDGDIGRVELARVADQGVLLAVLPRVTAVHLNFGRRWRRQHPVSK